MRQPVLCTAAAVLGGVITLVAVNQEWAAPLLAQRGGPFLEGAGPRTPAADAGFPEHVFDEQGLTPDESVNVAVYNAVNRSG